VIRPEDVADFVRGLPVEKLFGVGQVTASKLHALGVKTCGDMQALGPDVLIDRFGKQGYRLHEMAHGRDERAVVVSRIAKSVSVERTFSQDLPDMAACQTVMASLVADLNLRLSRKARRKPIHKLFIKIRYSDFSTHTLERVREQVKEPALDDYLPLLAELVTNRERPVRLLGLGVRFRNDDAPVTQLRLFD
jgi:DNA polymerase-4